ncbi:uncharacterized protein F4822DRAFT_111469 [Hypoxylon trugodes]|uniref:uncharacterized protein n=1 Tax=Hypoxylon trugodes TaxID=326681 RepID=UPI0021925CB7|nr:uncharacterized protein F4822DRAFT_111469 [Hypoxylon trugodes]KAI1391982.1 hypothetical protein F4822DRAFT_111469 [Hypoxylon trugodes]
MTTYVWKAPGDGSLQQVQIGAADVIATLSAAATAWGWIGGLDGIKGVLQNFPRLRDATDLKKLGVNLQLKDATCNIITMSGVFTMQNSDGKDAFGGHPITQLIGLTICALAYKLGTDKATQLFMDHFADYLLQGEKHGMVEALHLQLIDNATLIINEGATRGLHNSFEQAIQNSHLARNPDAPIAPSLFEADIGYVVGLLRWIRSGNTQPYLTRSAVVCHVAICLKEVGYMIGVIRAWDGEGEIPTHRRGIILVTGGSHDTDPEMLTGDTLNLGAKRAVIHYYRQETVGSLLFNIFGHLSTLQADAYDNYFRETNKCIKNALRLTWANVTMGRPKAGEVRRPNHIAAVLSRKEASQLRPSKIAVSLAHIYFADLAEIIAPCYEVIAQDEVLAAMRAHFKNNTTTLTPEAIEFRIISLSIFISIAEILAGPDYDKLQHAIKIDVPPDQFLESVSRMQSHLKNGAMDYWEVVMFVAVFHAHADPSVLMEPPDDGIVGYRDGAFAVLPALIFHLKPDQQALGLRCVDEFYSLPVQSDNKIRSSRSDPWLPTEREEDPHEYMVDYPKLAPADVDIYLSVERLPTQQSPVICLAARHGGYLVGTVGIKPVIDTINRSPIAFMDSCKGHSTRTMARILQSSDWLKHRLYNSIDQDRYNNYITVANHPLWALFLAGQDATNSGGVYIVFGCFDCTAEYRHRVGEYLARRRLPSHTRQSSDPRIKDAGAIFVGFGGLGTDSYLQLVLRQPGGGS